PGDPGYHANIPGSGLKPGDPGYNSGAAGIGHQPSTFTDPTKGVPKFEPPNSAAPKPGDFGGGGAGGGGMGGGGMGGGGMGGGGAGGAGSGQAAKPVDLKVAVDDLRQEVVKWETLVTTYDTPKSMVVTTGLAAVNGDLIGAFLPRYQKIQGAMDKWVGEGVTEFDKIGESLFKAASAYDNVETENAAAARKSVQDADAVLHPSPTTSTRGPAGGRVAQ
ncbi:MAG: hypothetical protein ACR2I1_01815, partial [Propionibacteriaceae bacterium]